MSGALIIRNVVLEDARSLVPLLDQLGYELDESEIARRLGISLGASGHSLRIGLQDDAIVAFMHCYLRPAIDKPFELVVQALVVEQRLRGHGLGAIMMNDAESLAAENGCDSITLSSHERRADAHRFYMSIGYSHFATSAHFRKVL